MRDRPIAPPGVTCRCGSVIPFIAAVQRIDGWVFVCRRCGRSNLISRVIVASVEMGQRVGRYGPG